MATKLSDKILGFSLVLLLGVALVGGLISSIHDGGHRTITDGLLAKGALGPRIVATRLSDQKQVTTDQLTGKVVVLDFWATWCPPCREEAPVIRDIAQHYAAEPGVVVMAMDTEPDLEDPVKTLTAFVAEHHLQGYPVAIPAHGLPDAYQVQALPTLYVLGKDGTVRFRATGEVSGDTLRAEIEAALKA